MNKTTSMTQPAQPTFHAPAASDGPALHRLIASCPPLDTNSMYCNLLQCTHFSGTSILARLDDEKNGGELVGSISGYLLPEDDSASPNHASPNHGRTLFVWQVAVADSMRGQGLAGRMLLELLQRPACRDVNWLHTSVTPDNTASRAMFAALARKLSAPMNAFPWFERDRHFGGDHDDEVLLKIGPFTHAR